MYYVISYGPASDNGADLYMDPVPHKNEREVEFTEGVKLGPLPVMTFKKRKGDKGVLLDYSGATPSCPVVSARFKEALDSVGVDNIDYYPAHIVDEAKGKTHEGYYAANVIGMLSCLDKEKSVFTEMIRPPSSEDKDLVSSFEEMHLDYNKVQGAKIFRLYEMTSLIIVNEAIKQAVEKAKLRGLELHPVEGFSGF